MSILADLREHLRASKHHRVAVDTPGGSVLELRQGNLRSVWLRELPDGSLMIGHRRVPANNIYFGSAKPDEPETIHATG